MHVVTVEGPQLAQVLDLTYPVWHEGLSRRAYAQWNSAQQRTPWGRTHLRRVALVDSAGQILSTAKRYDLPVRLDGRDGWMLGVGAVFTPPERRGQGFARTLMERLMDEAAREGALLASLFSEIGTDYYARLGFAAVRLDEVTVRVRQKDGSPAMLVRGGDERDLPAIAALHATRSEGTRLALRRDAALLRFALAKKRTFAGLSPSGERQVEFVVAEEGASAVAYAVISGNRHGWTLEDAGDRDPASARLGAMLQVLLAREPSHAPPLLRAWWPRALAVPPQVQLTDVGAPRDVLMLRPLADVPVPTDGADVFYWHADVF